MVYNYAVTLNILVGYVLMTVAYVTGVGEVIFLM